MHSFKYNLDNFVKQITLDETTWNSEKWELLFLFINQEVLTDAFEKHNLITDIFPEIGEIIARKCKSMTRIEKKMTEQYLNRENYFKVISDFLAIRIHCNVNQIKDKIDYIKTIVISKGGYFHIRGSSVERPYGGFLDSNLNFKDIVQYMYVYLEEIGYVIEIQIGNEFATQTFTIDSELRDDPNCKKVDLWTKGFYDDVKSFILNKANNIEFNDVEAKNNILIKANDIHQNNIHDELLIILNNLY